jgi:hypothetical protein
MSAFPEGSKHSKITNKLMVLLLKLLFLPLLPTLEMIFKKRENYLPNERQPFSEE